MKIETRTKLDIALAVPGLPFNGKTFDEQSLGGSETAGYYMGRALAAMGHRVTVFCNTEPMRCADVDYLPIGMYQKWAEFTQHDASIVQRTPELFTHTIKARFTALWCHDLALKRQDPLVKGLSWNYDKLLVLSDFMRQQYKEVYAFPDELLVTTRNGVDLPLIKRIRDSRASDPKAARNPLALVYTARPERGLDVLLSEIMPRILEQEPSAKLFLASYNNPVAELAEFYAHCKALGDQLGDSLTYLGHLNKERLYEVMQSAGLMLYPIPSKSTPDFDEVSCISAMEAQACGLPIVTTARGALPETIAPEAGVLVSADVHTPLYYEEFAQAALRLMRDPEAWKRASQAGIDRAEQLDWSGVAEQWTEMFYREIEARSADKATLANHFFRRSDIYAAKACLATLPADDEKSRWVREQIADQWAFLEEPDGFRKQYERIGSTHNPDVINWSPNEPRYHALRHWLATTFPAVEGQPGPAILDYGCAHGGYAVNLLKDLPHLRITGVDIDMHGIELAYSFAEKLQVQDRWRGVVGGIERLRDPNLPEMQERYKVVLAQEVLEHVEKPWETLKALEELVEDDGLVYVTVPFGPWEYTDYLRKWGGQQSQHGNSPAGHTGYPYRAHIWEFDPHDLRDMLDAKGAEAELTIQAMSFGHEPNTNEALGWWVISYKVTPETRGKVGEIDMARKLWCQRPRLTLSVNIMAGGPAVDETLHWCLRSLEHVADEVIVVDCGISDEAKRILSTYDSRIRIVPGVDPKTEGFETPRNIALEHSTQDMVLWIDCDEKVLSPERIHKYLRWNIFQGYSIKQHHFACDTHFDPDMPVRLFRNNNTLRFFGMIHEHPEKALNEGPGLTIVVSDVHIPHVGYLVEPGRERKFERNLPMLEADMVKYPDRKLQKHFIMRDKMIMVSKELHRNGEKMTEALRQQCRDVIQLYREHFLGKGHFSNVDPITYYHQAVSLLGEGFSVAFQVAADKFNAQPNGATVVRFATREDAEIEITHRVRQATQPYESRYW